MAPAVKPLNCYEKSEHMLCLCFNLPLEHMQVCRLESLCPPLHLEQVVVGVEGEGAIYLFMFEVVREQARFQVKQLEDIVDKALEPPTSLVSIRQTSQLGEGQSQLLEERLMGSTKQRSNRLGPHFFPETLHGPAATSECRSTTRLTSTRAAWAAATFWAPPSKPREFRESTIELRQPHKEIDG